MTVTTVYRAPDDTPHHCELKNYEHLPLTSIVRCDDCGTYWERHNVIGDWVVGYFRRVTRWNRTARRRIKAMPPAHVCDGHCILSCPPHPRERYKK